jgi:hypothetical protein
MADALAASDDALTDWAALNATIDQAHNEWLEVLTDLGLIGLGLVGTALGLTFVVGARALPGFSPTRRWTMIALLASLAAIIVEEFFNPSLRRPGLPAVYYSVIGLIWALAATPETAWPERVRHSSISRWAIFPATIVLAIGAWFLVIWDFDAARAQVQTEDAVAAEQWDRAEQLARDASAGQLSPQRRLSATQRLSETYLLIARADLERFERRMQDAASRPEPSEQQRRAALALQDRRLAELRIAQGLEINNEVVSIAKFYGGSGAVCSALEQLKARLSEIDQKPAEVGQHLSVAAQCLLREMRRRPYDPDVCIEYARLTAAIAGLERIEDVILALARPLRYQRTDARTADVMMYLYSAPQFAGRFNALVEKAQSVCSDPTAPAPPRPTLTDVAFFAPEILRLGTVEPITRNDYERSRALLDLARARYEALRPRPAFALAACLAELADSTFLSAPEDPSAAIAIAERAIQAAPDSAEGRILVKQAHSQIATYLLAQGDEAAARERLARYLLASGDKTAQDRELGERYARLCRNLQHRQQGGYSPKFVDWVKRALQLNPESELAWRFAADIALTNENDDKKAANCLRRALKFGADPRLVASYVTFALTKHPDSQPLLDLQKELYKALGTEPPATQPATSQPATSQPGESGTAPPSRTESQPTESGTAHPSRTESQPATEPGTQPESQPTSAPDSQPANSGTAHPSRIESQPATNPTSQPDL